MWCFICVWNDLCWAYYFLFNPGWCAKNSIQRSCCVPIPNPQTCIPCWSWISSTAWNWISNNRGWWFHAFRTQFYFVIFYSLHMLSVLNFTLLGKKLLLNVNRTVLLWKHRGKSYTWTKLDNKLGTRYRAGRICYCSSSLTSMDCHFGTWNTLL